MRPKVSDKAPLFDGIADDGSRFSLGNLIGKTNIVLYFYPKDETYGCTKEACGFRDDWGILSALGATVVGVSSDSVESHKSFKAHHSLPFTLVSDENRAIRRKYGVTGSFLGEPRVTFVIDKQGVIRYVLNSQLDFRRHVQDSVKTLQAFNTQAKSLVT